MTAPKTTEEKSEELRAEQLAEPQEEVVEKRRSFFGRLLGNEE